MRAVRLHPSSEEEWDLLFEGRGPAGYCQSLAWARTIQRVDKAEPIFLRVEEDDRATAYCLLFRQHLAGRSGWSNAGPFRALSALLTSRLDCRDGPVFLDGPGPVRRAALASLLDWIEDYARRMRCTSIRWQGLPTASNWTIDPDLLGALAERGYEADPWATSLVDLTQDEEALWRGLTQAARKCVKKCRRKGVGVERLPDFDSFQHRFYQPYAEAQAAFGLPVNPPSVFQAMFEEDAEGRYAYLVAADGEGRTLAALGMYHFNHTATEIASLQSPLARELKLPAQDLIHWEMLLFAKSIGCDTFDLAGFNPSPASPKEAGIRRFKEKWGGEHVPYNRFEKLTPRGRLLARLRRAYSGLRRRG